MPRGTKKPREAKKAPDFDAKIEKIDEEIGALSEKIKSLKAERKDLLAQKGEHDLKELDAVLKAAGKSPADVKAMLDGSN